MDGLDGDIEMLSASEWDAESAESESTTVAFATVAGWTTSAGSLTSASGTLTSGSNTALTSLWESEPEPEAVVVVAVGTIEELQVDDDTSVCGASLATDSTCAMETLLQLQWGDPGDHTGCPEQAVAVSSASDAAASAMAFLLEAQWDDRGNGTGYPEKIAAVSSPTPLLPPPWRRYCKRSGATPVRTPAAQSK